MNQPVHIFKKDAVHLWPEILVTIGLLAALVWVAPHNWGVPDPDLPWLYPLLSGFIKFLIPVAWLVLISRLVHDETLVGDRQFWITRPYTWHGLLLGKLLFLIVFLFAPLSLAQFWLLHHAGFHPTTLLLPFFENHLRITAVIVLPLFAIAAVTSTFVRFALSALGAIIYVIAAFAVAAISSPEKLDVPYVWTFYGILLLVVPVIAIVLQYSRRKTAIARGLLLALPAVVLLLIVVMPVSLLLGHSYSATFSNKVSFNPDPGFQENETGQVFVFRKMVNLRLPLMLEGLAENSALHGQHATVSIDGPNGFHYEALWSSTVINLIPSPHVSQLNLRLPKDIYDRIGNVPVAMHLTLGVERYEPDTPYNVTGTEKPFPIVARGSCHILPDSGTLICGFPFGNTEPISVTSDTVAGPCVAPDGVSRAQGVLAPSPLRLPSFDPVSSEKVGFQRVERASGTNVCPGAKMVLASLHSAGEGSLHLEIPSITVGPYAARLTAPRPKAAPQPVPAEPAAPADPGPASPPSR